MTQGIWEKQLCSNQAKSATPNNGNIDQLFVWSRRFFAFLMTTGNKIIKFLLFQLRVMRELLTFVVCFLTSFIDRSTNVLTHITAKNTTTTVGITAFNSKLEKVTKNITNKRTSLILFIFMRNTFDWTRVRSWYALSFRKSFIKRFFIEGSK